MNLSMLLKIMDGHVHRVLFSSTLDASGSEQLTHVRALPKLVKSAGLQMLEQLGHMWNLENWSIFCLQRRSCELCRRDHNRSKQMSKHCHLPEHDTHVTLAFVGCLGITLATSFGLHRLDKKSDCLLTLLPGGAMRLLEMSAEINLALVAGAAQLANQRQALSLKWCQQASIQCTLVERITPNFSSIR